MTGSLALVLWAALGAAGAEETPSFHRMSEQEIAGELLKIHKNHPNYSDRLASVSERFLGTPYRLGPLGEGPAGEYDRDPLYDFKAADCTTLIEQVMAMSLEKHWAKAAKTLQKIRYHRGKISYQNRNHFTEIDWISRNTAAGYLRDITESVGAGKTRRVVKNISKRAWYAKKTAEDIQGFGDSLSPKERQRRLQKFRDSGKDYDDVRADLPIITIENFPEALAKIPSGTIVNIIREDNPEQAVMVTHQMLFIVKEGKPILRHAAYGRQVEDVPALEYFFRYFGAKWRLVGVNLNQPLGPNEVQ